MKKTDPKNNFSQFIKLLEQTVDENGVRNAYRQMMGIKDWEAPFNCDGYYASVLYEFKYGKKMQGKEGAKSLAQACYYLKKFVTNGVWLDKNGQYRIYAVPTKVVAADENEALIVVTKDLEPFFMSEEYDWNRTPSSPDEKLIQDLMKIKPFVHAITDESGFSGYLDSLSAVGASILSIITRDNFDSIFEVWRKEFATGLDTQQCALAFLLDLENKGVANPQTGAVLFDFEGSSKNIKLRVPVNSYNHFWSSYKRPPSNAELSAIYERKDRLVAMQNRRMDGEFFTPLPYAKLAHEYLAKAIPDRYEGSGNHHSMYDDYNWFDPCCYSEDTQVLTYRGWVLFADLLDNDLIYSYNQETKLGEYVPFVARQILEHDGDMHHYVGKRLDFLVTPNHSMYIEPRIKKIKSVCGSTNGFIDSLSLYEWNHKGNTCRLRASAKCANGVLPRTGWTEQHSWLLGFYLGDGYLGKRDLNNKPTSFGWHFKKQRKIDALINTLNELNMTFTIGGEKSNYTRITCNDAEFLEVVTALGDTYTKHIPSWIKHSTASHLKSVLDGLMESDGCDGRFYSSNKKLAEDTQQVAIHLGYATSMDYRNKQAELDGRTIEGWCYEMYCTDKNNQKKLPGRSIETIQYTGKVYCITLAKNHIMLIQRNGKSMFCGNCGSGNLTYHCPSGMKGKLFMSTLNQEDVDICEDSGQNPNAQIFRYDFLNQTDEELPVELREKLIPGSKWIFIGMRQKTPLLVGGDE